MSRRQRWGRWEASGAWIPCCGLEAWIGYFTTLCSYVDAVGPVGCRWVGIGGNGPHQCVRLKERQELWYCLPSFRQEMLRAELRWPLTRIHS